MQVNIVRVRVCRGLDNRVISKEVIGRKSVSDASYSEAIVKAITGLSCVDAVGAIHSEIAGRDVTDAKGVAV